MSDSAPPTSQVPEPSSAVRAAKIRWDTIENMYLITLTSMLLAWGKMDIEWWAGINGIILGVVNIPKALGKGPQSIGMLIGTSALTKKAIAAAALAGRHL